MSIFDAKTLSGRLVQAIESLGGTEVGCASAKYRCFRMPDSTRHYFVGRSAGFRLCPTGPTASKSFSRDATMFLRRAEDKALAGRLESMLESMMTVGAVLEHKGQRVRAQKADDGFGQVVAESDAGGHTALRIAREDAYGSPVDANDEWVPSELKPAGGDPLSYGVINDDGIADGGEPYTGDEMALDTFIGHPNCNPHGKCMCYDAPGWDPIAMGA